jgi:Leucine-rich repeat (LRR) protein
MLITLDELDLSNNQIEVVNENLLKVSNIESLNLTGNRIKAFETTENQLYNLKKLDLSNNNLINIPDGLKNLKGLKRLNLSYNQNLKLDEICDLIDYFDDLKLLLILDCKTDGIPKNIEKLKKVGTIIGHDIFTIDELKKLREMGINISIPKTDW